MHFITDIGFSPFSRSSFLKPEDANEEFSFKCTEKCSESIKPPYFTARLGRTDASSYRWVQKSKIFPSGSKEVDVIYYTCT